jgi:hypothetical protein
MKSPRVQSGFLLCCLLATHAAELDGPTNEPVHNGRPLSDWVDALLQKRLHSVTRPNQAVKAVRAIGTNAIPWLLRELTATPWTRSDNLTNTQSSYLHQNRARWGFWALGNIGSPAIPELIKLMDRQPDAVPSALAGIGGPAVPALELCLTNVSADLPPDGPQARRVASALGGLIVAIDTDRILTNQAARLLPTIDFWTQSSNRTIAYWARGVHERLSPENRPK